MTISTDISLRPAPTASCREAKTEGGTGADGGRQLRLFGLDLFDTTLAAASSWIVAKAVRRERTMISFVNAHCINTAYRDTAYLTALRRSDRVFVDGSGMRIAARWAGERLRENVNGTDLFPLLCKAAASAGQGLFLFGGGDGIAAEAGARMVAVTPGLSIRGVHHGYLPTPADEDDAIARINASGASILLVGLGVPRQELWIARNLHRIEAPVVIGVGGLFDYYSGRIPRAPWLLRQSGMEWAWRLAMEPRRLAGRYVLGNAEFLARVLQLGLAVPDGTSPRRLT